MVSGSEVEKVRLNQLGGCTQHRNGGRVYEEKWGSKYPLELELIGLTDD